MIDLNADLGEGFGQYTIGNDESILKHITSANIACGFHAGDPSVMHKTVEMALQSGVSIGAHPGYPDLQGFGRRALACSPEEVYDLMLYQIGALNGFVKALGGTLQHVKPHGALYNEAVKSPVLSSAIAQALSHFQSDLILMGPADSALEQAANSHSIPFAREVFADRAYDDDGHLVNRHLDGALIHEKTLCIQRMLDMLEQKPIQSINGHPVMLSGDTICLHGDHPEAVLFAKSLRETLVGHGHTVSSLGRWLL